MTILVVVELSAAILAGLVAGWAVALAHVDPEVGFGVAFVAALHALAALLTGLVLAAALALGLFSAITGRLPRALGGRTLPRRYVIPLICCGVGFAVAVALLVA